MPRTKDNAVGKEALGQRPSASCRLDWLSVSLFGATVRKQREQLSYFFSLLGAISDGATWPEPSPAKFFQNAVAHEAGISIKWTEPGSGDTNQGLISVDLKGTAFLALEREHRKALYLDIAEMEGFKQCTRLDAQRTVLSPAMTAEQLHERLVAQRVWVKSYQGFRQMGPLTGRNVTSEASTVMWGAPESAVRARSYNKAAEAGWDVPAVRHEVQLRRQPARDKFNALIEQLQVEQAEEATTAENAFVQSVLNQHMAYLDTSRFAKLTKKNWPKNWAQRCENADWWDKEVVTGDPKEIKTVWRLQKKLEDSVAAGDAQYGRIFAKWLLAESVASGESIEECLLTRSAQWFLRTQDGDLEELLQLLPKKDHDQLLELWSNCRQVAAHNAEC
jgi:hypothetical protein